MMKRLLVPGLISLIVSGCAPTPYRITQVPLSKNDVKLQTIDTLECDKSSQLNWPGIIQIVFCGIGAKVCQNVRDSRFEHCMVEKGYRISAQD